MTYRAEAKVDLRHPLVDGCAREVFSIFLASLWPFPSGVVAAHQYI